MIQIFINGRFLTQPVTGVQRYAIELVKAFDILIETGFIDKKFFKFTLLTPKNIRCNLQLKHISSRSIGCLKGHLWEQFELPLYIRGGLLLNLCNTAPVLKRNEVITIHDAAVFRFPEAYSRSFRTWYKFLFKLYSLRLKTIITVSHFSEKELLLYCPKFSDKISVIHHGKEHITEIQSDETVLLRHNLKGKKYILAASSLNPNKNFTSVIQAMKLLEHRGYDFVIAGGVNTKVFNTAGIQHTGNVRYIGYVTDAELKALYEHAGCFVYPSFYEGFGFPPLEAMTCGCPVIVSDIPPLREVCGDAVLYCDPRRADTIAEKIDILISDELIRNNYRQKGFDRSGGFTWDITAKETFKVLEKTFNFHKL